MAVDTKRVSGRRQLRFASYDELLGDVRTLAAGSHKQLGNWSLAQICEHLAHGFNAAIDGPPFKPPLLIRLVGPYLKNRVLTKGLSPGFQVPKKGAAILPVTTDSAAGVAALETAVARLQSTPERKPHVVFGPLTSAEWDQFQLRHCELHLSFIVPA